jgi:hypothetical protein
MIALILILSFLTGVRMFDSILMQFRADLPFFAGDDKSLVTGRAHSHEHWIVN